jgi:hypothetical protein
MSTIDSRKYLVCQEEPEETFGKGFAASGCLGEDLLAFRDCLATESDSLLRIEDGAFPYKTCGQTSADAMYP